MLKRSSTLALVLILVACNTGRTPTTTDSTSTPEQSPAASAHTPEAPSADTRPTRTPQPTAAPEELSAIYNAAISRDADEYDDFLVIVDTTSAQHSFDPNNPEQSYTHALRFMPTLERATWDVYITANQQNHALSPELALTRPYTLVAQAAMDHLLTMPRPLAESIAETYPDANSYIALSTIGYNPDAEQALVYITATCGAECGRGNLYLLSNKGGRWIVISVARMWDS